MTASSFYRTGPVKRSRRTKAEIAALDAAIVVAVQMEAPVTVRGVFYRVVSAEGVEKTEAGYGAVQRRLLQLRRTGVVPYAAITDGTRLRRKPASWNDLDEMLASAASSYRRALWADQDAEVIILSEKDAITSVVYPVTAEFDVELCIARGFGSETFIYEIAQDVIYNSHCGKTTFLYNLGDHDPSGVNAWAAFSRRVREFAPEAAVEFERLAVTPEQIDLWSLPTRPTKATDSRSASFVGESVEVDAIAPSDLRQIVREAIEQHIDPHALRLTRAVEASERNILTNLIGGTS